MTVSWRAAYVGCCPAGGKSILSKPHRSEWGASMSMAFSRASARTIPFVFAFVLAMLLPLVALAQTARPEAVGMSSERLQRLNEMVDRYMASGDITGAVTLVARNGRIVHLQAQGVTDAA